MRGGSSRALVRNLGTLYRFGVVGAFSDEELIERYLAQRDETADEVIAKLVQRHRAMALCLCRRMRGPVIAGMMVVGAAFLVRAAAEPGGRAPAPLCPVARPQAARPPGKPLIGIVRDPEGRPVASAKLVAGAFNGRPNHRIGATGPDGRFELTPEDGGPTLDFVVAYRPGFAPASARHIEGRDKETEVEIVLPRPAPFVGLVKDRGGRPIKGASVWVLDAVYPGAGGRDAYLNGIEDIVRGTALESLFRAKTDAQGRFELANLPRRARVSLVVTAPDMGEYNTRNHKRADDNIGHEERTGAIEQLDTKNHKRADDNIGHEGTTEVPTEIVMAPAARVVGRVMSRWRSVKVAGMKVGMQGSQQSHGIWGETVTDAEGRFIFDGLDEGTANIFLMDYPNDGPWTYRAVADTPLKAGQTTEVKIELIRGVQVEGQVVDAASNRPVPGVGVGLYGPIRPRSGAAIISEKTDKDGRYRFRLPPGETMIYICGPAPPEYGDGPQGGTTVRIPDDVREFAVPAIELRKRGVGR